VLTCRDPRRLVDVVRALADRDGVSVRVAPVSILVAASSKHWGTLGGSREPEAWYGGMECNQTSIDVTHIPNQSLL